MDEQIQFICCIGMVVIVPIERLAEAKTLLSLEADVYHTTFGAASVLLIAGHMVHHSLCPFLMTTILKASASEFGTALPSPPVWPPASCGFQPRSTGTLTASR